MGGGEAHALGLTLATAGPEDEIFLISETDFDVDELGRRFGYDLGRCRKLVISTMTREFTARFDIFINSTFRSNLGSLAKQSFYIVSFPHQEIRKAILKDYVFLHNSRFTQGWAECFWGPNRGLVVCPTFSVAVPAPSAYAAKQKLALSIGRITDGGTAKTSTASSRPSAPRRGTQIMPTGGYAWSAASITAMRGIPPIWPGSRRWPQAIPDRAPAELPAGHGQRPPREVRHLCACGRARPARGQARIPRAFRDRAAGGLPVRCLACRLREGWSGRSGQGSGCRRHLS